MSKFDEVLNIIIDEEIKKRTNFKNNESNEDNILLNHSRDIEPSHIYDKLLDKDNLSINMDVNLPDEDKDKDNLSINMDVNLPDKDKDKDNLSLNKDINLLVNDISFLNIETILLDKDISLLNKDTNLVDKDISLLNRDTNLINRDNLSLNKDDNLVTDTSNQYLSESIDVNLLDINENIDSSIELSSDSFQRILSDYMQKKKYITPISAPKQTDLINLVQLGAVAKMRKVLSSSPIDIGKQTASGNTALLVAARQNRQNIFEVLIEYGADKASSKDILNRAFRWADYHGNQKMSDCLKQSISKLNDASGRGASSLESITNTDQLVIEKIQENLIPINKTKLSRTAINSIQVDSRETYSKLKFEVAELSALENLSTNSLSFFTNLINQYIIDIPLLDDLNSSQIYLPEPLQKNEHPANQREFPSSQFKQLAILEQNKITEFINLPTLRNKFPNLPSDLKIVYCGQPFKTTPILLCQNFKCIRCYVRKLTKLGVSKLDIKQIQKYVSKKHLPIKQLNSFSHAVF